MITPIRFGDALADHADYIASYCRALAVDAEFKASLATSRGHLTMANVDLHSARLSLARAQGAVNDLAAKADAAVRGLA